MSSNKKQAIMNYTEHITTVTKENGTEYKLVRLQKYCVGHHEATNKYYVNGKIVTKQSRYSAQMEIDMTPIQRQVSTERNWIA